MKKIFLIIPLLILVGVGCSRIQQQNVDPLSYPTSSLFSVLKNTKSFDFSVSQLQSFANECGSQHVPDYFDKLVSKFGNVNETIYTFKYIGKTQDSRPFAVTLLPNIVGYKSLAQFKKDFDICEAGGETYPFMLNSRWLVFVSSCGGADDGSGLPDGCNIAYNLIEPNLKLK